MPVNPTTRNRLEAQGFCGLDDATIEELAPWMRWTYTLGALVTIIGVALMSPAVLWAFAAITLAGVFLPFHPFDLLYNNGVRYLTGKLSRSQDKGHSDGSFSVWQPPGCLQPAGRSTSAPTLSVSHSARR